ncbi:MAG: Rrf2 family transcriptional regulator [Planctomycetaceae bacterium]|nr:Rrf2 family transcriptional regulator [Planctomycetaceae bacterium]
MFSKTAEYALRSVLVLARRGNGLSTTDDIAAATHVPPHYLRKVLQSLSRAGIVSTQRGIGGGISLSRPDDEITVLDVVNAVDPIRRYNACPLGLEEHGVELCPLHSQLDDVLGMLEQVLGQTTIADLLRQKRVPAQCRFPNIGKS